MRRRHALILSAFLPLWACSGGGGGGTGGGGATSVTPTPTPTATSTPTPANAQFTVEAAGAVGGSLDLIVGEDATSLSADSSSFATDILGMLLPGVTHSPYGAGGGIQTAGFPGFNYSADYALRAYGVENPTRLFRGLIAPRKSTAVSPLTSLIAEVRDQSAVKRALGLGATTTFLLPADIDLTTYSATQDAASSAPKSKPGQVLAANVRVLALAQAVEVFAAAPGTPPQFAIDFSVPRTMSARIAAYIKANPTATLDSQAGISAFLRSLRAGLSPAYRDDIYETAASLIHNFDLATRLVDDNPGFAPRFAVAVMGALRPRLDDLAERNSAAAAASGAVSFLYLMDEASRNFSDQLAFPTGAFVPLSDFFRLDAGGTLTVYKDNTAGFAPGGAVPSRPNMTYNDLLWSNRAPQRQLPATIRSISVPAGSAAAIAADLQVDGNVVVTAKPGFTGIAWYDYVSALDTGQVETGRVYLFVR
ncbi:hypothetical protein HZY97_06515 [Sphingomonas sp. R-74633]|uniref:hypothetical protein n=1 Tax=Sphingomonas sp. R-74633 TaxID=2751188 RepID=UPI0015D16D90|nr:hypothetical protein [Sphingomonas sp. R-74633]NYT40401.1 hypothetical protein [Sphingomonas sp. R-74633]